MVPPVIIPKNESLKTLFELENEKNIKNPKPLLKIFDKNESMKNSDKENKNTDENKNKLDEDNSNTDLVDKNTENIKKDPNSSNKEINI